MLFSKKWIFFIILMVFSSCAMAAKDPISWQLSGNFDNTVFAGNAYSVTYTFTNQLPLQLVKPIVIDKVASPANEFSYIDTCSGVRLNSKQSCTVRINLNPSVAGAKSVHLIIGGYARDRVPLPSLTTQVQGQSQTSLNIKATVTQSLPGTLRVGTSANYSFKFQNIGTTTVTSISAVSNVSGFTTTCGTTLTSGNSCIVSGTFTPTTISPSVQSVIGTFTYKEGSPVTAKTSTNIPPTVGVVGSFVPPNYLPAVMIGGSRTIQLLFTNYGPGVATITSDPATMVNIVTGTGGSYQANNSQPGNNSCLTGLQLPVGGACQTLGTFTAPTEVTPTPFALTGTVTYTGGTGGPTSSITTSTTVVNALTTSRTVTFDNQCGFPVWFSLNGGALANSPNCKNNASVCPSGTTCNAASGLCYWNNYAPSNNTYELSTGHLTNTVTIPLTSADPTVQWSGNFSASTLCSGSTCGQASCQNNGGTTSCAPGIGFTQPATQAEITMLIANADSYDVEVINGMHIPISMAPGPYVQANNFSCSTPGSPNPPVESGFGACTWTGNAVPPTYAYNMVSNLAPCPASFVCAVSGQVCGLDSTLDMVCGDFLGYWTSNQACAVDHAKANPYFGCDNAISTTNPPFPSGSTLKQLMACSVPTNDVTPTFNSCYQDYPSSTSAQISTCCGCVDWWTVDGINANSTAQSCTKPSGATQTDPTWTSTIQGQIQWLKKACPSIYTYPFDDATSGFNCTNNLPGASNSVGYTITFCPGGDTGLPSSVTEGRG
ncbi:MAG: thaumatin family protein [Gammaproteobacteria bacterium]|nr:thaumatin family protein [Gammaproteobacteria bacterium]